MLWLQRGLSLRPDPDAPPRAGEIVSPLIVWSITFEIYLPQTDAFARWCTADPLDVLCYGAGALAAAVVWRLWYAPPAAPIARPAGETRQRIVPDEPKAQGG